ncbi:hypothetical protein MRX96_055706 [Rhipicephalus microplus]
MSARSARCFEPRVRSTALLPSRRDVRGAAEPREARGHVSAGPKSTGSCAGDDPRHARRAAMPEMLADSSFLSAALAKSQFVYASGIAVCVFHGQLCGWTSAALICIDKDRVWTVKDGDKDQRDLRTRPPLSTLCLNEMTQRCPSYAVRYQEPKGV